MSSYKSIVNTVAPVSLSEEERAIALWRFTYENLYYYLQPIDWEDYKKEIDNSFCWDALKLLNVYGFCLCYQTAYVLEKLFYEAGMTLSESEFKGNRKITVGASEHSTTEVYFKKDKKWHMLDASYIGYSYLSDGKTIASADNIKKDQKLITQPVKCSEPYYPFPQNPKENVANIYTQIDINYPDVPNAILKFTYEPKISLRDGEMYILSWENEGKWYKPPSWSLYEGNSLLHFGTAEEIFKNGPYDLPKLNYLRRYPYFGNGKVFYQPNLKTQKYLEGIKASDNIEQNTTQKPYLHLKNLAQEGYLIFEMKIPYVIVEAYLKVTLMTKEQEQIKILVSTDNKTWEEVYSNVKTGEFEEMINLVEKTGRWIKIDGSYAYLIKFQLQGYSSLQEVGINKVEFINTVQLAPSALPELRSNKVNNITVTVGNAEELTKTNFVVVYCWLENGVEKKDFRKVTNSPFNYTITTADKVKNKYIQFILNEEEIDISKGKIFNEDFLYQSYPNPFNPECFIPYTIRHQTLDYRHQTVKIRIYNILGQEVREIDLGEKPTGSYVTKDKAAYWDGRDSKGKEVVSGMYYYELVVNGKAVGIKKSLVVR